MYTYMNMYFNPVLYKYIYYIFADQLSVELLTTSSPSSNGPDDLLKPKERNALFF